MRFWMVRLLRFKPENNFLRDSSLCWPIDTKRKIIWLKNWYLVIGSNDVRDACRRKSFQNNKRVGTNKNYKRLNKNSVLYLNFLGMQSFLIFLFTKEPWKQINYKRAFESWFFQKVSIKIKKDRIMIDFI